MGQIVPDAIERYLSGLNQVDAVLEEIAREGRADCRSSTPRSVRCCACWRPRSARHASSKSGRRSAIPASGSPARCPAGGMLLTMEMNPERARVARANFARAGVADRVSVIVGDAQRMLAKVAGPFDLIFQDGDKPLYEPMLDRLVDLLRPGGLLVTDNVLWDGEVVPGFVDHAAAGSGGHPRDRRIQRAAQRAPAADDRNRAAARRRGDFGETMTPAGDMSVRNDASTPGWGPPSPTPSAAAARTEAAARGASPRRPRALRAADCHRTRSRVPGDTPASNEHRRLHHRTPSRAACASGSSARRKSRPTMPAADRRATTPRLNAFILVMAEEARQPAPKPIASWPPAAIAGRCTASRSRSRICFDIAARRRPPRRACVRGTSPRRDAPGHRPRCARPARSSSARRTCTSSRSARRTKTRRSVRRATRTIRRDRPADRAADRRSASPPAWRSRRSAPIPAARSGFPPPPAASSA